MLADRRDPIAVHVARRENHLRHADRQVPVAARPRLHVPVAVPDGLRHDRVDDDRSGASRARLLDDRHHVDVGDGRVPSPDQEEARVRGEIERVVHEDAAEREVRAVIRFAAAEASHRLGHAAVQVEEALAHDLEAAERAVALVIEHGQRAVTRLRPRELL